MSKPARKPDGQISRVRQSELDMFWKEYESIEPRVEDTHDEEDEHLNGISSINASFVINC